MNISIKLYFVYTERLIFFLQNKPYHNTTDTLFPALGKIENRC